MSTKKILFLSTEISPFLQTSSLATVAKELAESASAQGNEVRVFMPKHWVINERTHRMHPIQRLYGLNIGIEEEDISLIVKVASIKKGGTRVYFIDNEDLFQSRTLLHTEEGVADPKHSNRIVFLCRSVWTILENLGWAPDIIHCLDWSWALVPMYGKELYCKLPLFSNTKFVYTFGSSYFSTNLGEQILKKAAVRKLPEESLAPLGKKANFAGFLSLAKKYSDKLTYSFSETHTPALDLIKKLGATHVPSDEHLYNSYQKIYQELLSSGKK